MPLYVKGEKDNFWHWCKNCDNYPSAIEFTTVKMPVEDLCPECYEMANNDECEKGKSKLPAGGVNL